MPSTTQHLLGLARIDARRAAMDAAIDDARVSAAGRVRAVSRARARRVSWTREIVRLTVALANVAAISTLVYLAAR